jgi:hypothetical protein
VNRIFTSSVLSNLKISDNKIITSSNNYITIPDVSDTLVTLTTQQTLIGKTLVSPVINAILNQSAIL